MIQSYPYNKSNFSGVFREAFEGTTTGDIRKCFESTGIYPFNPDAIDKTRLVGDVVNVVEDEPIVDFYKTPSPVAKKENVLVRNSIVSQRLSHFFIASEEKEKLPNIRKVTKSRTITSDEYIDYLKIT